MLLARSSLRSRLTAHNRSLVDGSTAKPAGVEFTYRSFDGNLDPGSLMETRGLEARSQISPDSQHSRRATRYVWLVRLIPTFQVYAARGYAVLYLNPRGSGGYGQKFSGRHV